MESTMTIGVSVSGANSLCKGCRMAGVEEPADAVAWVRFSDGVRRWYCADHLADVYRFEERVPATVEADAVCHTCRECGLLTLKEDLDAERTCRTCRGG